MKRVTKSVKETMAMAEEFADNLKGGEIIFLKGDLAAGKTSFTKGLAKGLDIEETVNSPTFTILKEYEGRVNLKHIDAYRLEESMWDSFGFYDLMDEDSVIVVEWPQYLESLEIDYDYLITFKDIDENTREIEVKKC